MQNTDIYNYGVNKNYSKDSKNMHIQDNVIENKFEYIYLQQDFVNYSLWAVESLDQLLVEGNGI